MSSRGNYRGMRWDTRLEEIEAVKGALLVIRAGYGGIQTRENLGAHIQWTGNGNGRGMAGKINRVQATNKTQPPENMKQRNRRKWMV